MKKILISVMLLTVTTVFAQHHHNHGHWQRGYGGGWNWMVPAIIGGVLVYEVSKNQQPVPQPIMIQQTTPAQQYCSPWTETQNPDGTITRTRTCTQ
jgi:hypothetical protein